ncbi:carboxypeptidase, partial [Lactobacillus sp. XV13L]|nr:carboxypeptidase [Lactobacillus sp. XV13L]
MQNKEPNKNGLGAMWHRFDSRFFIGRWIILIMLSIILLVCTYYTVKVKTSNISDLKASLPATTAIYDYKKQQAGTLYSQKGTFVDYDKI